MFGFRSTTRSALSSASKARREEKIGIGISRRAGAIGFAHAAQLPAPLEDSWSRRDTHTGTTASTLRGKGRRRYPRLTNFMATPPDYVQVVAAMSVMYLTQRPSNSAAHSRTLHGSETTRGIPEAIRHDLADYLKRTELGPSSRAGPGLVFHFRGRLRQGGGIGPHPLHRRRSGQGGPGGARLRRHLVVAGPATLRCMSFSRLSERGAYLVEELVPVPARLERLRHRYLDETRWRVWL